MLEIKVTNDTPNRTGATVGINKMEINTRLLSCRWRYRCYWWYKEKSNKQ